MSSSSTISTVSTTITSSALSSSTAKSDSNTKINALNTTEIAVIVSIAIGLLILIILVFVIVLRRRHRPPHPKYEHSEDGSKFVDAVESPQVSFMLKPSKDDLHSMFKRAEADPFIITQTEQRLPPNEPQYLNDAYTRPFSSVKNDYEGLATHEMHIVSLDTAQSPTDDVGFEAAALRSSRPSSSRSTIKLAPLSIPEKTLNRSNGERSIKRAVSRKSSKPPDSAWETDDSASLYSAASASASHYFSKSSLEPVKPPPVPPIPIQFTSPTQSTLPKGTDVIVIAHRRDEEKIITKSPPLLSLSLPSLKFNGDNVEEVEEDENETQIYNVAKLLHSRQSKLPKDVPSRNSSIVSHIERSGSIRPVISPTDEDSYRPRYYRLKQKRDSYASNLSPTHNPDSLSTLSSRPRVSLVGS